ncbi:MAG: primosomal protein N', partial [Lachnospiraceae bacterium]|nr:primosomal protein N' [Lachnospiraceae bacterium]
MNNTEKRYADVIIDISSDKLDKVFSYRIPENMRDAVAPGSVVMVPFGKGDRSVRGYVTGVCPGTSYDPDKVKDIGSILTDGFDPKANLIGLAAWMRERYGCTMAQALRTVLPVKKAVREKEKKSVTLCLDQDEAAAALDLMRKKHQSARVRLLEALISGPSLPWEIVRDKLHITLAQVRAMEEMGILKIVSEREYRAPFALRAEEGKSLTLTEQQRKIADTIISEWDRETEDGLQYLIHGITGSGKTEVYIELIAEAVRRHQQAIVLIPEIALTYQTLMRFYRRFGDRVSLIHSRLSAGERYDQFERAARGEIDVMIGPRSALFTPFPDLGIIVIDEEHEPAYISEGSPGYHASEVALERVRREKARLVMGSATPSLQTYHAARTGAVRLFKLPQRPGSARLPETEIVDLREEMREGNGTLISRRLREEMEQTLSRGEQIMLFINRRGYAGFVSCRSCGKALKCPHCDVSLSLHNNGRMMCHYCGYSEPVRKICPSCGSGFLRSFRAGTQQIEEETAKLFPQAGILRMDMDTTRGKDEHTAILSAFSGHEADILIGTQMIVKGHDFPDVTLVGILAADLSLNAPDYRAAERTFQLITQAAGRAGRADKPGRVIIQTYDPQHYSIQCGAAQDYESFYEQEMVFRSLTGYPPAGGIIAVRCSGTDEEYLQKACGYLASFARRLGQRSMVSVLGPADEPIAKIQDTY